ncbi:MAG TPA: hypothetical protein EYP03_05630, partial [Aquificae bacterium]|nr:hypothetical protein [Aquificota bacterium]
MKYYLIGISGIGMSALAFMLKDLGYEVLGSTKEKNYICSLLENNGIKVIYGHKEDNITKDIDFVVYSSAIKKDHIELKRARKLSLALLHRSDLLNDLINLHKKNILVTGTHGKTTTTSLISYIFYKAKRILESRGIKYDDNSTCLRLYKGGRKAYCTCCEKCLCQAGTL